MLKVTALEHGYVEVERQYFDGVEFTSDTKTYCAIGSYVHAVYPNGTTGQVCRGLRPIGPTLMTHGDLEATIRKTLRMSKPS